jgi:hypothetical protein
VKEGFQGKPNAFQFRQQVSRTPPARPADEDVDPTETLIRKPGLHAIGAQPAAPAGNSAAKFAEQVRTTMKRKAEAGTPEGVPACLRLLPPDLLERWRVQKPQLLARVQAHLDGGELHQAYNAMRELLYDAPRLAPLIDDIFLVEAYSQLPEAAREALPATSLKSVLAPEALPAFADVVDTIRQGDGTNVAQAMAELADQAPAAERLVAHKLKQVLPKPPAPDPAAAVPELRPTKPTVQAAFTPPPQPAYTPPPVDDELLPADDVAPGDDDEMAWLYELGLQALWSEFVARCESRQWDGAWDAAEAVAMGLAEVDPEHERMAEVGEAMAMRVADGILSDLSPELAMALTAVDLIPVMASGGTTLLLGCNDSLAGGDWTEALERMALLPEEAQLDALAQVIIQMAWPSVPRQMAQAAVAADLVACWVAGGASAIQAVLRGLRSGDRRGTEDGLRQLAGIGASNTKIALLRAKLGWQKQTAPSPGLRPR